MPADHSPQASRSNLIPLTCLVAAAAAVLACAACQGATPASAQAEGARAAVPSKKTSTSDPKTLKLSRAAGAQPIIGAAVEATAEGLPPNRSVELMWETVDGGWVVEDGFRFKGK